MVPTFESVDEILNNVTIQRKSGHVYFILRHLSTDSRSLSTNKYFLVLPHVMEYKTDWYTGPLAVDSGF